MYSLIFTIYFFFFFNDTAPTEISPLPLPDALPIWLQAEGDPPPRSLLAHRTEQGHADKHPPRRLPPPELAAQRPLPRRVLLEAQRIDARRVKPDRKSTRLNSSH